MKRKSRSIYECGVTVKIKLASIEGMITCASIRFDSTQYEITYWVGREQKTVWVREEEFETTEVKTKIGYV